MQDKSLPYSTWVTDKKGSEKLCFSVGNWVFQPGNWLRFIQ